MCEQDSSYGNIPSHLLFDKIEVERKKSVEVPRASTDYEVSIERDLPEGVSLHEVITF